jgi:hypothetical protein
MVGVYPNSYYNEPLPPNQGASLSFEITNLGTSAQEVKSGGSRLSGRRGVFIKNRSDVVLKWGFSDTTCTFPLYSESGSALGDGGEIWIDVGDKQAIWIKTVSGSNKTFSGGEIK